MLPGEKLVGTELSGKVADGEREGKREEREGKSGIQPCQLGPAPRPFPSPSQEAQLKWEAEGTVCSPAGLLRGHRLSTLATLLAHF